MERRAASVRADRQVRRAALAGVCLSVLAAGGAAAQTAPSLSFGGSTLTFDGTNRFTIPTYAGIDIGTGAFTIAFQINASVVATDNGVVPRRMPRTATGSPSIPPEA